MGAVHPAASSVEMRSCLMAVRSPSSSIDGMQDSAMTRDFRPIAKFCIERSSAMSPAGPGPQDQRKTYHVRISASSRWMIAGVHPLGPWPCYAPSRFLCKGTPLASGLFARHRRWLCHRRRRAQPPAISRGGALIPGRAFHDHGERSRSCVRPACADGDDHPLRACGQGQGLGAPDGGKAAVLPGDSLRSLGMSMGRCIQWSVVRPGPIPPRQRTQRSRFRHRLLEHGLHHRISLRNPGHPIDSSWKRRAMTRAPVAMVHARVAHCHAPCRTVPNQDKPR